MKSQRVLELGCGTGFLGIIIAALQIQHLGSVSGEDNQPGSLYLTDNNDAVLSRCHDNSRLRCSKYCYLYLTVDHSDLSWETYHHVTLTCIYKNLTGSPRWTAAGRTRLVPSCTVIYDLMS